MINVNGTKAAKPQEQKTKCCQRCGEEKPETSFYSNKGWKKEGNRDRWCKECYAKIRDKDGLMEYLWENNHGWNEDVWNNARTKAQNIAVNNDIYLNSSEEKKVKIIDKLTVQQVSPGLIKFEEHDNIPYSVHKRELFAEINDDPNLRQYSAEFNGYFNARDLAHLKEYYTKLEQDFSFVTESDRDYAHKVCKASLQADKAMDDYVAGRCDYSVVKDAIGLFDTLSKSGNFAACKRTPGEDNNTLSISEISMKLEMNGHPCTRIIEWPKDDVDKTTEEFGYIVEALDLTKE